MDSFSSLSSKNVKGNRSTHIECEWAFVPRCLRKTLFKVDNKVWRGKSFFFQNFPHMIARWIKKGYSFHRKTKSTSKAEILQKSSEKKNDEILLSSFKLYFFFLSFSLTFSFYFLNFLNDVKKFFHSLFSFSNSRI